MGILPDYLFQGDTFGGPGGPRSMLDGIPDWLKQAVSGMQNGPSPYAQPSQSFGYQPPQQVPQSQQQPPVAPGYYGGSPATNPLLNPATYGNGPTQPQQPQQQQQPTQMAQAGTLPRTPFGESPKVDGLGNRLYEAVGGFFGNEGMVGGLANAAKTLATGEVTNPYALAKRQQLETYAALQRDFNMTEPQARMAMQNPKVMEALLPIIAPKFEFKDTGQYYGRFNPATGRYDVQGAVPKFEQVTQGNTAGYAAPPTPPSQASPQVPGTAGANGGFQPLMQGGMKTDDISGIRKEVSALPEVKRFSEALPIFRSMTESHRVNTSAADLDFVYGVAKIFDPESVVREGEMKLVGKAQSLPEDIRGFIESVTAGGRLTPEARARILDVAKIRMNELKGSVDQRLEPYHGIADRNKINRADILPQFQGMPETPIAKPGDPGMTPVINMKSLTPTQQQLMKTAPENTIIRADGKRVIKKNGEWVPYGG